MANLVLIPEIVVDEVALDGLDGLTIETLWVRLVDRTKWPSPLNPKIKESIWSFVVRQECFRCFRLPNPRPSIRAFDREEFVGWDNVTECPFTTYKSNFIELDGLRGSCEDFGSRELIQRETLLGLSLSEAIKEFGETLVIVGSQEIRDAVLIPKSLPRNFQLSLQQYCLLERIGRSRFNGEVSFGQFAFFECTLFHVRKLLLKFQLIVKQTYYEKMHDNTVQGLLFHLPRFFRQYKAKQLLLIEHLVETIKLNPNCLMEYTTARAMLDEANRLYLRKLYKQPVFAQFFETDIKVPYRQVYPDAKHVQYYNRKKAEERVLHVFRLRNPNIDVRTMWTQLDDDTSDNEGFLDQSYVRLDMSLKEQVYQLLKEAKQVGLTQREISLRMGLTKLGTRGVVRTLERSGLVTSFMQDAGRQRVNTYILKQYKESINQTIFAELNAPSTKDPTEAIPPPENTISESPENQQPTTLDDKIATDDANISADDLENAFGRIENSQPNSNLSQNAYRTHLNEISVEMKILTDFTKGKFAKQTPLQDKTITLRLVKRMQFIEQYVRQCRVLEDFAKLYLGLQKDELKQGYTDTLCRRTLYRMIAKMSKDRKLRMLEVNLRSKGVCTQLIYICIPDIQEKDELLLSLIEREKHKFLLRLGNEHLRLKRSTRSVDEGPVEKKFKATKTTKIKEKASETVSSEPSKKRKPFISQIRYGSTPKFHKIRSLHEFLFYLVYEYPPDTEMIHPSEAIGLWKQTEPRIDYEELQYELPFIYTREISWKMFVAPIIRHPSYNERGWFLLADAILRMPLSIYVSISNMLFEVPGLDEILAHPIRKHYLLCNLPPALQDELMGQRKHVISITDCCRRASSLGLVQFGPQRQKDRAQVFLYLNQNASQLNTITSEPGYYQISKQDYPKIMYNFNTSEDVASYWSNLHSICTNTRLGKRMVTDYVTVRWDLQPAMVELWHNHTREFVLANDSGELPGDALGAGGLDSSLFAHLHRNWSFQRSSKLRKPEPKKVPIKQALRQKSTTQGAVSFGPLRAVPPIKRANRRKSQHVIVMQTKKRNRQQVYDDVDRQALRKMVKLRVDWNQEEDNLLLLCRAAMQKMFPTVRKLNISSQQIRDILHWSLKSFDKTSRACQRRIVYMMKKESVARKVHLLVQEIEQNRYIENRFGETFYPKLMKQIPNENDALHALRTAYVELVYLLKSQLYTADGAMVSTQGPVLPKSLAEFHQIFSAKYESYTHDRLKYNPPTCPSDIQVNVMTTIIHSSCCCVRDKTSWNIQLYEVYKNYPDRTLSKAMTKVRDDQLISANKVCSKTLSTRSLPLSTSKYHLSVTYQHLMLNTIPVRLVDATHKSYLEISASAGQSSFPLVRIEGGCFMFLAEMLHHNPATQIEIGIPDPVLVFDSSKCPENAALLDRINNRFRSIFDFVQNDNKQKLSVANINNSGGSKKSRRVTISTGEPRAVEFYVSPVEKLMKMDESMFHFYCVLDAVGRYTSVANLSIDDDKRCSFDCVLGNENPVGKAVEIIKKRADLLPRIIEEDQMDFRLVNEFEISTSNVLSVFNVLVNKRFGIEQESIEEAEEFSDHGMPQLSMEILNDDQDPNAMNVDMGEDDSMAVGETEPQLDKIINQEEEADGDLDDVISEGKSGEKIYKMHDYFFLNPCRLSLRLDSNRDLLRSDPVERDAFLQDITSECVWKIEFGNETDIQIKLDQEPCDSELKELCSQVLDFLASKTELGATNVELTAKYPDRDMLLQSLQILQSQCMVLQTGVVELTFVHCLYAAPWLVSTYNMKRLQREAVVPVPFQFIRVADWATNNSVKAVGRKRRISSHKEEIEEGESSLVHPPVDVKPLRPNRLTRVTINKNTKLPNESQHTSKVNFQLLIKPWIRINGSLNRRVLDRWMSVLLTYCLSNPCVTIERLAKRFNLLVPVHVRKLAEYMERLDLVILKVVRANGAPACLWSKYEPPTIANATRLDSIDTVFVEVKPNALTLLGLFIGEKQYNTEFV